VTKLTAHHPSLMSMQASLSCKLVEKSDYSKIKAENRSNDYMLHVLHHVFILLLLLKSLATS